MVVKVLCRETNCASYTTPFKIMQATFYCPTYQNMIIIYGIVMGLKTARQQIFDNFTERGFMKAKYVLLLLTLGVLVAPAISKTPASQLYAPLVALLVIDTFVFIGMRNNKSAAAKSVPSKPAGVPIKETPAAKLENDEVYNEQIQEALADIMSSERLPILTNPSLSALRYACETSGQYAIVMNRKLLPDEENGRTEEATYSCIAIFSHKTLVINQKPKVLVVQELSSGRLNPIAWDNVNQNLAKLSRLANEEVASAS